MREWFDHGFDGDSAVKSATQCSVWVLPKCTGPCYTQRTTRSPKQNYTAVHLKLPPGNFLPVQPTTTTVRSCGRKFEVHRGVVCERTC